MIKEKKECYMDFLKLGKNKLKISLTKEDLRRHRLEKITADDDLSPYKTAIFSIIDIAEERGLFSANGEKLLLQFYPIKDGGELFVTKLSVLTEAQKSVICRAENLTVTEREKSAYILENMKDARALARSISARVTPPEKSAIYLAEDGSVMLELEEQKCPRHQSEFPEICEFATPITKDMRTYLCEHSVPIITENALKILSEIPAEA